jgi:hypothetical protein
MFRRMDIPMPKRQTRKQRLRLREASRESRGLIDYMIKMTRKP